LPTLRYDEINQDNLEHVIIETYQDDLNKATQLILNESASISQD